VPAGELERRFFVLDVGTEHQQDTKYFAAIDEQMQNGGREALLHLLQHYDLKDFNVRVVPGTRALREQQKLSLPPEAEWWIHKLEHGQLLWGVDGWPDYVPSEKLVTDFVDHTKRFGSFTQRSSETALGMFFSRHWPKVEKIRRTMSFEKQHPDGFTTEVKMLVRCHQIPPLAECRKIWEKVHGPMEWSNPIENELPLAEADLPPTEENPF
jgi:hypothetical protein